MLGLPSWSSLWKRQAIRVPVSFFSTHHAEVVEAFASRVLTLSHGRIADDRLL